MHFPIFTGDAARFLKTSEPRLAELVMHGRVKPPPPIIGGRRFWNASHLFQAASKLGLLSVEVRQALEPALEAERAGTVR